jgi:hypothetical protein
MATKAPNLTSSMEGRFNMSQRKAERRALQRLLSLDQIVAQGG